MVDAATGSETQALLASVAQPDLRIVLTLSECRYRLVARRSAGIRELADLRGKRVAVTRNTSAEYFLAQMLETAQLQESEIKPIFLEGEAMPSALVRQEVDAMAIWEPYPQKATELLGDDALVLENASVYHERFNLNTTLRVLNDPTKRSLLVSLVRGVMRVSVQLQSSPRELIGKLAKALSTPEPVIANVWARFRFPAELDERQLRAVLVGMEPWAAAISGRPARPEALLAAMIDGSVFARARK
jgi:NitT/TauT family transport system substrate-binding protein